MNTRRDKKINNKIEVDTIYLLDKLENNSKEKENQLIALINDKHKLSMDFKTEFKQEWEKRQGELDQDINRQNTILSNQNQILHNQDVMLREILNRVGVAEQNIEKLNTEIETIKTKLNNMGKIELSTLAKVAWGGLTAIASAGLALLATWITKKF